MQHLFSSYLKPPNTRLAILHNAMPYVTRQPHSPRPAFLPPIRFPPSSAAACCAPSLHHAGGDEFYPPLAKVTLPCPSVLSVAKPSPGGLSLLSRMPRFQTLIRNKVCDPKKQPPICTRVLKKRDLNLVVSDFDFVQTNCKPSGIGAVNRDQ